MAETAADAAAIESFTAAAIDPMGLHTFLQRGLKEKGESHDGI
jgi:predicted Zn-dependent protease